MEKIETFIANTKADIRLGGTVACYFYKRDYIEMPDPACFPNKTIFYSVAFHELVHWTSHESRLDFLVNVDPSRNYQAFLFHRAYGEVVAHIGAGLLCIHFGLSPDVEPNRARLLYDNFITTHPSPTVISAALRRAKKAVRYLQKLQPKKKH